MNEQEDHTPLPWVIEQHGSAFYAHEQKQSCCVFMIRDEANARFIVRAANHFYRMLLLCEDAANINSISAASSVQETAKQILADLDVGK